MRQTLEHFKAYTPRARPIAGTDGQLVESIPQEPRDAFDSRELAETARKVDPDAAEAAVYQCSFCGLFHYSS